MNFKDLLNTDHEAIIQWLRHAFRWWMGELTDMVPARWRERFLTRASVSAEFHEHEIVYRKDDTGEILAERPRKSVKVLLPAANVLVREIELPVLPVSDVKRMVTLDLDRLTPFRAEQVLFDTEIISRDEEAGRQKLLLGVVHRSFADAILERARANDIVPAAISVESGGWDRPRLDFLPAIREAAGGTAARRRAAYFWAAAGVLLVFNLFMLTYRDANATAQLREAVESQQSPVTVAMRLRDKVQKEEARRTALMNQKKQNSPLPVLEAVTNALPNGAWVSHFEWNGRTVHVRGIQKDAPDLLAKLEAAPLLRNARSLTSDPQTVAVSGGAFDLAVDRQPEKTR
jgi:general secretion pathway protein L